MKKVKFPLTVRSVGLLSVITASLIFYAGLSSRVSSQDKTRGLAKVTAAQLRPVSSHAVNFAESRPVRELYLARTDKETSLERLERMSLDKTGRNDEPSDLERRRDESAVPSQQLQTEREINKINRERGRVINRSIRPSRDGALSTESPIQNISPQPLPTPSLSFEGISIADTISLGQGFLPPDTVGEAGPNHFVQAVNVAFRVWDKSGNPLTPTISIGSLFSSLPLPCRSSISGDPTVAYDQLADRWIIGQICWGAFPRHQLLAVSKTPDPTGSYYLYDFEMPNTKYNDYPKFGVWPDGYYMTDNQFDKVGVSFRGVGYLAFDRTKMLRGDPTASYVYFDSCPENQSCKVFGGLPSDLDGNIPPPTGAPNTFAVFTADEFSDPQGDGLRLFDFHVDFAHPENSSLVERTESPFPVAAFDPLIGYISQPSLNFFTYLDPIGDRLMNRLAYRNFGNGREALIATHSVDTPAQDHSGVRYYELDRSSPSAAYAVAEQQTFAPDSNSRWMASGAMNRNGDTALGYSVSSTTVSPSIRYAARFSDDPSGSGLFEGEQTIIAGGGYQTSSSRRWGDYSQMTVDPTDDCSFWYTQEYYVSAGSAPWHTRIAKFTPRPCEAPLNGTIQGAVTSCSSGLPLAGAYVEASNGFQRLTAADGSYSMNVLPGAYGIGVGKDGFTNSTTTLTVANGETATKDFCVSPVAVFPQPSVSVITGNAVLEPNECNLLNIPIKNTGASDATGVTAVLSTSTPGVTITAASSAYPDLISGGSSVKNTTPFQVTTDDTVACFSDIDLKLTLNYSGGGSPAVVNFKAKVGQATGPNYAFTPSSGASIPTTGTLIPGSRDSLAVEVSSPFGFSLYGRPVAAGTKMSLEQAGVIEIIPLNQANPVSMNNPLPAISFESPIAVLMPFWGDLEMRSDEITGSGIFTEVTGTAPNRTYMVEWRAQDYPNHLGGPFDVDVAVFFHENSDNFEYVYGMTGEGAAANGNQSTVGIQGKSWGTNYTQYNYYMPIITAGLKLSASRPSAICFRGSGVCGGTTRTAFDFDGDSKADVSIFRPTGASGAEWWYQRSIDGQVPAIQFGSSTDIPVPADYTADGKTDIAFFRPSTGEWFILRSEDYSYFALPYGQPGDIPVPGDYDGDHKADIAVYRPSSHYWYLQLSSTGVSAILEFGLSNDQPVPADYDGDGKQDPAVWRPNGSTGGEWWGIKSSTGGPFALSFGSAGDKAVPADYTGDGKTDFALWRPSTGQWFISRSEDFSYLAFPFGTTGDLPVPADYDGDGKADAAVFRSSTATWYINRTGGSGFLITNFGASTDRPVPGIYVR